MLAILTTHPIQYQVPIWKRLAARGRIPFKVFYMSDQGLSARFDRGFGRPLAWDIDLLGGYNHEFIDVATGPEQESFWWLRLKNDFGTRLKSEGARVLWTQGWQVIAYWQAVWQARAAGLQTWLRAETNLRSTRGGWLHFFRDPALGWLLHRIDVFLCVGAANRQFYLARGVAPSRLRSAPYCVENERFARQAEVIRQRRSELRAKWSIPTDAFCVAFVGKLIKKKRPLDIVNALQLLTRRIPDRPLHLLIVGTGELADEVRSKCSVIFDASDQAIASRTSERSNVNASFAGFLNQAEIAEAYVAADCLALPSDATETWGLVVNEAMACGLPAVVSDACGCSDDLVRPMRPDLTFPVGNLEALANSLHACGKSPPSRQQLARVIDRYDVLRTVENIEALYLESLPLVEREVRTG